MHHKDSPRARYQPAASVPRFVPVDQRGGRPSLAHFVRIREVLLCLKHCIGEPSWAMALSAVDSFLAGPCLRAQEPRPGAVGPRGDVPPTRRPRIALCPDGRKCPNPRVGGP